MKLRIDRCNDSLLEDLAAFMGLPDRADHHEVEWTIRTEEAGERVAQELDKGPGNWTVVITGIDPDDFDGQYTMLGIKDDADEGPCGLRIAGADGLEVLGGILLTGIGELYVP